MLSLKKFSFLASYNSQAEAFIFFTPIISVRGIVSLYIYIPRVFNTQDSLEINKTISSY